MRDAPAAELSNQVMPPSSTVTSILPAVERPQKIAGDGPVPDFASIYTAHSRAIFYLALRLMGDSTRAEDVVHDVFLKAFRNLGGFRQASEIRTWLYRIAINHCRNLRKAWHERHILNSTEDRTDDAPCSDHHSPFRLAEAKDLGRQIQRSLDAISPDYRLLLLLVADEEMSYDQIAELTGQSADSVRGKIYRARKAFREAFNHTV